MLEEASCNTEASVGDIEDISTAHGHVTGTRPVVNVNSKRKNTGVYDEDLSQSWRTVLGPLPPLGRSRVSLQFYQLFHVVFYTCNNLNLLSLLTLMSCTYL